MTREEVLALHQTICNAARTLMEKKSHDYSHGTDPFANFRFAAQLHIAPEKGVLLRIQDKLARLLSFVERGDFKVTDESTMDTIIDIINYSVLLQGMLMERDHEPV